MIPIQDFSKIIHKEGYIFIVISAAVTFLFGSFSPILGWIGAIVTIFCVYFFRNPNRVVPIDTGLVISPADGKIQSIIYATPPPELGLPEEELLKISIFLSIFDVHVNRIPADGKIVSLNYNPGQFINASLDKASIHNERQSVVMETTDKQQIIFVQIAGLIARRIVCDLEEGNEVSAGDRFGIIRFGSRVDIYLPKKTVPLVDVGQTCIGGETILADFKSKRIAPANYKVK
ncbi:phosphatidylserine decarboxylase family protein [Orientia chuto str. Dubai]|uniref:Phosphatidylserine decarboxylase proenzyme n=1 Tax=Orientia chuto str. Dubai TaxID=1359168 RepID=A0A0F3MN52_9RICK|nr:phosphatidylserine decarboxylase [Candidatus Orientia mediorientalis]KJV57193.1 phosphatidylserine decarboxylase family protein [Orientia chuto str. Dubai]